MLWPLGYPIVVSSFCTPIVSRFLPVLCFLRCHEIMTALWIANGGNKLVARRHCKSWFYFFKQFFRIFSLSNSALIKFLHELNSSGYNWSTFFKGSTFRWQVLGLLLYSVTYLVSSSPFSHLLSYSHSHWLLFSSFPPPQTPSLTLLAYFTFFILATYLICLF